MPASNTHELMSLCLLIDCDGPAPYLAWREDTDTLQLYDVDHEAFGDIEEHEAQGRKCRLIPVYREMNPAEKMRGAPVWMWDRESVPGVKQRWA